MKRVMVIHGPNLDLLGQREPSIYGEKTLETINADLLAIGASLGLEVVCYQSNDESTIVGWLHEACQSDGVIINPAALTHTSVAIRDAAAMVKKPIIEVHISNTDRREPFRRESLVSPVVTGVVKGLGAPGYEWALRAIARMV